jgi:uncharacterized damage-inducible protein DinB
VARERLLRRIDGEWTAFLEAADAAAAGQSEAVGGAWSLADLLGHVATWEGEFLRALPVILAGKPLPRYSTLYGGIDAFNARELERWRGETAAQARQRLEQGHADLVATLARLPLQEPRTEGRLRRRLRQDTYHHYGEHIEQVWARA